MAFAKIPTAFAEIPQALLSKWIYFSGLYKTTVMKNFKLLILAIFLLWTFATFSQGVSINNDASDAAPSAMLDVKSSTTSPKPKVFKPEQFSITVPLRDMVSSPAKPKEIMERNPGFKNKVFPHKETALPNGSDPVWQKEMGTSDAKWNPTTNFEGIANGDPGGTYGIPPDTQGDVGPNHYFQVVNTSYQIWDKAGNSLVGPLNISSIWSTFNPGSLSDPIVLYDEMADRWFVSIFEMYSPFRVLIAVSTTPDPTGSYYLWAYPWDGQPDYAKYGIWRDGYYAGYNNGTCTYDVAVFDRNAMLTGNANPAVISFDNPNPTYGNCILPLDNDGVFANYGTPGQFIHFYDDAWPASSTDQLWIYSLNANWGSPGLSTFSRTQTIDVAPFESAMGPGVAQPGTTQKLNILSNQMMYRAQYRKFDTHETIVTSQVVDVDNTDHGGIRWYELRRTSGNWWVYQESTYAPDAESRFMCSIAMNQNGDMALGYSVASSSVYPSIRYTGRKVSDPLNTMTIPEGEIFKGTHSQTTSDRWGDYSCMSVDPSDNTSFWYTTEYSNGGQNWRTRIAKINLDNPIYCTASGGCDEFISRVQMGAIDNSSGCSNYADYTTMSTSFPANGSQQITVTNGPPYYWTDECGIWVDWNLDGDFYDANEQLIVNGSPGNGPYTATISPPYGVTLGYYTLRIRIKYNSGLDPCGTTTYGEVEDYSIELTPKAPNYWTGASNSYWYNDDNWSLGHKPTPDEDVIILNVGFQPPIISFVNEECNNLTINTGAWVYVMETNLTINGNLAIFGQLSMVDDNGGIICYGDVDWNNNSTADFSSNSLFQVYGHWFFNSGSNAQLDFGTVNFVGPYLSEMKSKSATSSFNNIYINKNYNALKIISDASQPLVVNGDINIQSNSGLSNDSGQDIVLRGSLYNSGYYYLADPGYLSTFVFDGTSQYIYMFSANGYFNHLKISTGASVTLGGSIHTAGDLIIDGGLDSQGYDIIVEGDWINSVGPGAFLESTGRVIFSGSNIQNCSSEEFNILELDNAVGALYIGGTNVTCAAYDWTAGAIDVFNGGTFTANDLIDNGIYGKYVLSGANSTINLTNNDGYVDLDGELFINNGTMNVYGGTTPSYWPFAADATITMSDGVLDFHDQGIYIYNSPTYLLTDNITGGIIRTAGGFIGERADFEPSFGTFEFYGMDDYFLSQANGCTLYNVSIDKGSKSVAGKKASSPIIDQRSKKIISDGGKSNTSTLGSNFVITNDLTINSGELKLGGYGLTVDKSCYVHGTLTMDNSTDVLTIGQNYSNRIQFFSGSFANLTNGTINIYGWVFPELGCSFNLSTNNTIVIKGTYGGGLSNFEPTATYGNIVLDKNANQITFIAYSATEPIIVNGSFTINPGNIFEMQDNIMIVHGSFTDYASSEIYAYDVVKSNGPESTSNKGDVMGSPKNIGPSLEIDSDVVLNGFLDVGSYGNVLLHGSFDISATGELTISGGSFIDDQAYQPANEWRHLDGTINLSGGLFEISHNSMRFSSTSVNNISGGITRCGYTFYVFNNGIFKPTGGTVEMTGSGTIPGILCPSSDDNYFYDLMINRTDSVQLWSDVKVLNDIQINSGPLLTYNYDMFNQYHILVGGNWTNNGGPDAFDEATGTVTFFGNTNSLITQPETFFNLVFSKNSNAHSIMINNDLNIMNDLTIGPGSVYSGSNTIDIAYNLNINTAGYLFMQANSTLRLGNYGALNINNGGFLSAAGTVGNNVVISHSSTDFYSFNIYSGGILSAENTVFEYVDKNGLNFQSGSTLDPAHAFTNCTFQNFKTGYYSYAADINFNNEQTISCQGVYFPDNPKNNVAKSNNAGRITFIDPTGFFAGPTYEYDPYNRVDWTGTPPGLWTGIHSTDWFTPENWADYRVPVDTSNVTIPAGVPQFPVINGATTATCDTLIVDAGASLEIGNGQLDVDINTVNGYGEINIYGNLIMNDANGIVNTGTINWNSGSTTDIDAGEIYAGHWYFNDGTNAYLGIGNTAYVYSALSNQDADASFGNLVLVGTSKGKSEIDSKTEYPVKVSGDFTVGGNVPWSSSSGFLISGNTYINGVGLELYNGAEMMCSQDLTFYNGVLMINASTSVIVHGTFNFGSAGELGIYDGSFVCDGPYLDDWFYINGNLNMTSGLFEITNNCIQFGSTASSNISGGTIRSSSAFSATVADVFKPSGGTVEVIGALTSPYASEIDCINGNYFNDLFVDHPADGWLTAINDDVTVKGNFTLEKGFLTTYNSGTTLTVDHNVDLNDGAWFYIGVGGQLLLSGNSVLNVNNGGYLGAGGIVGQEAVISRTSGYYQFNVNAGGTIAANNVIFEYMGTVNGINIKDGAIIDPDYPLDTCTFQNGNNSVPNAALLTIDNGQSLTITGAIFPSSGTAYNVKKDVNQGLVTFTDFTGSFSGENFDSDPYNRIDWFVPTFQLDLKVFLEGPFNGTDMNTDLNNMSILPLSQPFNTLPWNYTGTESVATIPNNQVVDWVLVDWRDAPDAASATTSTRFARQAAFLLNDGNIVGLDGSSFIEASTTLTNNLFLVISHRNHLSILSSTGAVWSTDHYVYDFTTSAGAAYGNTQNNLGGVYGMIGGNGNPDANINLLDKTSVWMIETGLQGYLFGDFTMDGQVDNKDKNDVWEHNVGKSEIIP